MISTGHMNKRVIWQQRTPTSDGQGGFSTSWADVATEWAKVTELSSDRLLLSDGVKFSQAIQIDMRERGDTYTADPKYRISYNSKYWTIYSVVTNSSMTRIIAYTSL